MVCETPGSGVVGCKGSADIVTGDSDPDRKGSQMKVGLPWNGPMAYADVNAGQLAYSADLDRLMSP